MELDDIKVLFVQVSPPSVLVYMPPPRIAAAINLEPSDEEEIEVQPDTSP